MRMTALQDVPRICCWQLTKGSFPALVLLRNKSDYLHKSIVPTDHFQKSLPRLPVPDLDKTCSRYLESQHAFLQEDAFKRTTQLTEQFRCGAGKELQEELLKFNKANCHTSYITGFWFDMYLKDRRPVVLNHNPFMSFNPPKDPAHGNQLIRATNMLISSLKYCKTFRSNILEPEVYHLDPKKSDTVSFRRFVRLLPKSVSFYGAYWYKAFPLDMSQFGNLFNSTRIPRLGKDQLYKNETAKHVLVIRNGHFYVFDCFDKNGNILPAKEIMANLKYIQEDRTEKPTHPIGYLSSQNRDTWAKCREHLLATGNAGQLDLVDTALFAVALDADQPCDLVNQSKQYLYGDAANRWFDKSFSLIFTPKGEAAVNFEHSWGDGVAVMSYFNAVFKDSNINAAVHSEKEAGTPTSVRRLDFHLSDSAKKDIDTAKEQFERSTKSLLINFLKYDDMGKDDCKKMKLSPDSIMQLAFQMAYKRCYGATAATYESCSTSAFKHGRTETIRSATMATNKACDLFKKGAPDGQLLESLRECSAVHGELTKNAAMGQGWDRHLYALRHFAEDAKRDVALFNDEAYKEINTITLSTSTLSSPAVEAGGFAPVVPHGLGVGYSIFDDRLGAVVTAYQPHKKPEDFLQALKLSLDELKRVINP